MINVSEDIINEYLSDSTNKELELIHEAIDQSTVNYYTGDITDTDFGILSMSGHVGDPAYPLAIPANLQPYNYDFANFIHNPAISDWNYLYFSFFLKIDDITDASVLLDDIRCVLWLGNAGWHTYTTKTAILNGTFVTIEIARNSTLDEKLDAHATIEPKIYCFVDNPTQDFGVSWFGSSISVFFTREQMTPPTLWVKPADWSKIGNIDAYTITNDELLYEDFTLTESLCSQDNLKFGLCEAAHIEFETVNSGIKIGDKLNPRYRLADSQRQLSDDQLFAINWVSSTATGETTTASTDFSTWIQVITPSNFMADWSNYVDTLDIRNQYMNYQWMLKIDFDNVVGNKPKYIKYGYGAYFGDTRRWYTAGRFYDVSDYDGVLGALWASTSIYASAYGIMTSLRDVWLQFYDENYNTIPAGTISADITVNMQYIQYRIGDNSHTMPAYTQDDLYYANGTLDEYIDNIISRDIIPLGSFYVKNISEQYKHNLVVRKVEAYDTLLTLEQNAAAWYTRYMFGINTSTYTGVGYEYARQIFATYFNYAESIGLESRDNYTETEILYVSAADIPSYIVNKYISWDNGTATHRLRLASFTINNPDPTKLYKVSFRNFANRSDEVLKNQLPAKYDEKIDGQKRGVGTDGSVFVEITGDHPYKYCLNNNDYFMIPADCTSITIYVALYSVTDSDVNVRRFVTDLRVFEVDKAPKLVNGERRLTYYDYETRNYYEPDSSLTGRDVVRSLLEVCGCLFRISREGCPEFVYPTKGGLYPSNTLYPANDLYPMSGVNELTPMGKYMSVTTEDYSVNDIGRIQLMKNTFYDNADGSVANAYYNFEYDGEPSAKNTYIIDDNIFYCGNDIHILYSSAGLTAFEAEVNPIIVGMYSAISNLGYTPNDTEALGAPWLECGDRLGLLTYNGGFETFVFRRTLKGIQNLRDTYESRGDENIPKVAGQNIPIIVN